MTPAFWGLRKGWILAGSRRKKEKGPRSQVQRGQEGQRGEKAERTGREEKEKQNRRKGHRREVRQPEPQARKKENRARVAGKEDKGEGWEGRSTGLASSFCSAGSRGPRGSQLAVALFLISQKLV